MQSFGESEKSARCNKGATKNTHGLDFILSSLTSDLEDWFKITSNPEPMGTLWISYYLDMAKGEKICFKQGFYTDIFTLTYWSTKLVQDHCTPLSKGSQWVKIEPDWVVNEILISELSKMLGICMQRQDPCS